MMRRDERSARAPQLTVGWLWLVGGQDDPSRGEKGVSGRL